MFQTFLILVWKLPILTGHTKVCSTVEQNGKPNFSQHLLHSCMYNFYCIHTYVRASIYICISRCMHIIQRSYTQNLIARNVTENHILSMNENVANEWGWADFEQTSDCTKHVHFQSSSCGAAHEPNISPWLLNHIVHIYTYMFTYMYIYTCTYTWWYRHACRENDTQQDSRSAYICIYVYIVIQAYMPRKRHLSWLA